MKVIDTYYRILDLFDDGKFNFEKWKAYIDVICENSASMFIEDMNRCIATGKFTFEELYCEFIDSGK